MGAFNWPMGSITFETGSALTHTMSLEAGQASSGEEQAANRDVVPLKVRGRFKGLLPGEDIEYDFSVESFIAAASLTDASTTRLRDILMKQGLYASDTTVDAYAYEWALKVTITFNDGAGNTGGLVIPVWRPKVGVGEDIGGNKLTISGTAYKASVPF
jgi:hypothetical protein